MKFLISTLLILLTLTACKEETQTTFPTNKFSNAFSVIEGKIIYNEEPIQLIGANAFHVFGAGGSDMKRWNLDIAREFVGNVAESPLSGFPILDATGAYLHSLQAVVDSNRSDGRITIICPFGWNGADSTLFTGRMPSSTFWWEPFKSKLQEWAVHFKDQPDVWLEVWNEPYRFDRADG